MPIIKDPRPRPERNSFKSDRYVYRPVRPIDPQPGLDGDVWKGILVGVIVGTIFWFLVWNICGWFIHV